MCVCARVVALGFVWFRFSFGRVLHKWKRFRVRVPFIYLNQAELFPETGLKTANCMFDNG